MAGQYIMTPEMCDYYYDRAYEFTCDQILANVWDKTRPSKQQKQALDAISIYEKVGIASGHGVGKSCLFAWANLWFNATRPAPCRIPCTAPTGKQLTTVLWPEIYRWLNVSLIKDEFSWMANEVRHAIEPRERFSVWRTSDKSDNMQGFHAEHMLWLIDEAWGITDPLVWEVIEASRTQKDNKLFFAGNYTVVSGYAHDAFSRDKLLWTPENGGLLLTFNAEESEITDKEKLKKLELKWGRNHDIYRTRVLGLPPLGNPDAFITLGEVQDSINREIEISKNVKQIRIGIDAARKGNDLTVFAIAIDDVVLPLITMPKSDEVQIYSKLTEIIKRLRAEYNFTKRIRVTIDNTGGYGGGAYDLMIRDDSLNIEPVGISYSGVGSETCYNATSVIWDEFKSELHRIKLPDDPDLIAELTSRNFTFKAHDGKEKIWIEPKAAFKDRHKSSPDRADAVTLLFTKKAAKRKVWNFYPVEHKSVIRANWPELGEYTSKIISLWTEKDMRTSILICLWNSFTKKLFIMAEAEVDSPHADVVTRRVDGLINELTRGYLTNGSSFEWFGNDKFFGEIGGDMRATYLTKGVNLRENFKYNEAGAILNIETRINSFNKRGEKLLIFNSTKDFAIDALLAQMQEWSFSDREGGTESGYGLCRALCNIGHALYENMITYIPIKVAKPYSKETMEIQKRFDMNAKKDIHSSNYIEDSPNSWQLM